MKKAIFSLVLVVTFCVANAQNTAVLKIDSAKQTISKHIYGHFAEHLGRCIYDGFFVGDTSKIKNTAGVRNDIIDALKKLKIPNLRWPGGCFADTYHWKDGIGDKTKRPSIVNTNWGNVTEDNSFGTHDFLNMCKVLGCEPYLSGNVGSGTVQELADWVQYTNFDNVCPMSELRKQNGQAQPWGVRYWGIGNEAWGCGGHMTPEHYSNLYRQYATFMNNSPSASLFKIASGASDDDYNWTEVLMKNIPKGMLGGVAMHHYSVINWNKKGSSTNYTEDQYFVTMKSAIRMDELITKHSAIMDKYDPAKKVALVVDEWGGWYDGDPGTNSHFLYQQNTMRDALIAGVTLNIFNNHAERVRLANLAQCVNVLQSVILTNKEKMILTPTYHVMQLYSVHQNATLIPLEIKSNNYQFGTESLPAVSGSASKDSTGSVHISLTNIDTKAAQEIVIDLGGKVFSKSSGQIITSGKLQDYNSFESPDKIKPAPFAAFSTKQGNLVVKMPPFSVVVIELK